VTAAEWGLDRKFLKAWASHYVNWLSLNKSRGRPKRRADFFERPRAQEPPGLTNSFNAHRWSLSWYRLLLSMTFRFSSHINITFIVCTNKWSLGVVPWLSWLPQKELRFSFGGRVRLHFGYTLTSHSEISAHQSLFLWAEFQKADAPSRSYVISLMACSD